MENIYQVVYTELKYAQLNESILNSNSTLEF